jgi:hypothetical protein
MFCKITKYFSNKLSKKNSIYFQIQIKLNPTSYICASCLHNITNLQGFIGLYKIRAKIDFHKFVQKSHEFCVMVNFNGISTYLIS